ALARTGLVRIQGSNASQMLQVVPTLRGAGGTVVAGNTLLIEGTGLVGAELVVQAGGRTIGDVTVRTLGDSSAYDYYYYLGYLPQSTNQQFLTIVLPAGVAGNTVTVST
ncbi:MAG TPA: hypothetical protein PLF63_14085, partial [Rubrivivax sp.]|nr:hypothetical protein [Rubrivivax sp.]